MGMFNDYRNDFINEFKGYNLNSLKQDLMAGLTVTAVALPLALAFGVSSGATAASGLITAIIAGIFIGMLSGGSFQISGPTGAMGAILILLSQKYGLNGVFIASAIAGIILIFCGIFKLGKIVSYIPSPVITGFTTGIALIIAIGQLDNFFGVSTKSADSSAMKVLNFLQGPLNINWYAVLIGGMVITVMILWPKKWNSVVPSSLVGLILAVILNIICKFPVEVIGDIPKKLLLDERLTLGSLDIEIIKGLVIPAVSIAALAMIESLLCGEVGKKMVDDGKFNANRELIAQGIGNLIIPFFGGVPATAAIARTSVGVKAGGKTRLVSIFHSLFLLASMFILAPIMSKVPLSALAGVLMITAWRMNEWENIIYIFSKKFKGAISKFLITMTATVVFDLTEAIIIGVIFSSLVFIIKISNLDISINEIDENRLNKDVNLTSNMERVKVAYFTGPLFFGTVEKFKSELFNMCDLSVLILSMRGVPLIDTSGIQAVEELREILEERGCKLMLSGLQPQVSETLIRAGLNERIGKELIFWSAEQAIMACDNKIA